MAEEEKKSATDDLTDALEKSKKEIDDEIASITGQKSVAEEPEKTPDGEKGSDDSGKEAPVDEKPSEDSEKEPADKNKENNKKSKNTEAVCDGISKAYGDDDTLKATPQTTSEKGKSSWPKPPARGKNDIKVADGKDIMEVFWNEMWKLYDTILDFVVDTALDFVVFVLYPEKPSSNESKQKKADAIAAGEQAHKSHIQKLEKQKAHANAVHKEILDNLQQAIDGGNPKWELLKKEPEFFQKLLEIKKKALEDPNSPEAKMIEKFEKMPQVFEQRTENCKKIMKIAANLATMEEYLMPTTKESEVKRAKEQYKDKPDELKKKLEEIEAVYKKPEKEQEKMAERISCNMEKYYSNIFENIDKIKAENENDPEKTQETVKQYMENMGTSIIDAKKIVYDEIYKKGKDSKRNKEKAIEKIVAAISTINRTQTVEGEANKSDNLQKIATMLAEMEEYLNPSAKKLEIENAKKQYKGGELKQKLKEIETKYKDPETQKNETARRVTELADEHYQKIKENCDKIESTYPNDSEKRKKAMSSYMTQLSEVLQKNRAKVYIKNKETGENSYSESKKGGTRRKGAAEEIDAQAWSTGGILQLIKNGYEM